MELPYVETQPRSMRATSQIHYVTGPEQQPPMQYRASVQPAMRERLTQPQQIEISDRSQTAMPPPTRRIVVDQFGNRYMEAPAPMPVERPISRHMQQEFQYEQLSPTGPVIRRTQPTRYEEEGHYIQQAPPSPQYVEYPNSSRKKQIIHLDQEEFAGHHYDESPRIIRYEPRTVARYEDGNRTGTNQVRIERMDNNQIQTNAEEPVQRMSSVRPQPRLVRLGEHEDNSPKIVRQVSVRPDEGFGRQIQRVQGEMYQYAPQEEEQGRYVESSQHEAMYERPRSGSRRIVRV